MRKFLERLSKRLDYRGDLRLRNIEADKQSLISLLQIERLTYLSRLRLAGIIDACESVKNNGVNGIYIEAGCALGGSTILICKCKPRTDPLYVYDVFGMIPPPSNKDGDEVLERYNVILNGKSAGIDGDQYYGYQNDLYSRVKRNLEKFDIDHQQDNVHLVKGLIQETLQVEESVAFAHLDVDWYEPVKISLERIVPKLAVGGKIILDDYFDWSGCRRAVDEYLTVCDSHFQKDKTYGSLLLTKVSD